MCCDQSGSFVPLTINRLSESSAVRIVAVAVGQHLLARRFFRFGLHDVHRGHRADFDANLVVRQELRRERQRLIRDVDGLNREDVIPVCRPDRGQRVRRTRLQIELGVVAVDDCRLHLLARLIDLEPAQQRLCVAEEVRAVVLRVEPGQLVCRRDDLVVVERQRVVATAPAHVLCETPRCRSSSRRSGLPGFSRLVGGRTLSRRPRFDVAFGL